MIFPMKPFSLLASVFLVASIFLTPIAAFGAGSGTSTPSNSGGIENPIKFNDLGEFIKGIVDGVAQIGFYLVVIFIIYSGFLFVKARGNETELKKAKEAFLYTVIGAAILLGATVIANVIDGTIGQIRSGADSGGDTQRLP